MREYYAAPMEGLTGWRWRQVHSKLFGGAAAKSPVGGLGVEAPAGAIRLKNSTVIRIGDDFLIESEVDTDVHGDC